MFGKRSDHSRTSDDRARAAAERAARRAGRPLPPEAFEDAVRPPDVQPRSVGSEAAPRDAVQPEVTAHDDAPWHERDEASPEVAAELGARNEAPPRAIEPDVTAHEAESEAVAHEEAPLRAVSPDGPERDDAPAQREPVSPARDAVPAGEPRLEAASRRADQPPRREMRSLEHLHQPTVEYTPFQTEEHEAPLGDPRADEPELMASRHASTATAEHDEFFDDEPEEELRPLKPLRPAPPRSGAAPRRRPAPKAPRQRRGRNTPPPANVGRGTGNGHWGRRIFAVIAIAVLIGLLYVANATFQPFHGGAEGDVRVTIPENSDAGRIGDILAEAGVIDSATFFELSATIDGTRGSLRPGDYTLKKGMSNDDAIAELTKPPVVKTPVPTVTLTLVEGPSRRENAPVVNQSEKVKGDYARASSSKSTLARIRELGAPKGTKTAEGFLFPATYELPVGSSAGDLVKAQLNAFEENFKKVDMSYAKRKNLTRYDVLIIASLIEREASLAKERRLVSAVIYNRLAEGIPLGIDATTRYSTNNWTKPIKQSELDKDEPYNTRLKRGLPPTPIGNPGLASIKAAANPSRQKYLYYVRKSNDDSGEHGFYKTYAEFEQAVARYNASRDGG